MRDTLNSIYVSNIYYVNTLALLFTNLTISLNNISRLSHDCNTKFLESFGVSTIPLIPFTLQVVSPSVGRIWGNVPDLGSPADVGGQPRKPVANHPIPCESYGGFRLFKIFASDFNTMSMHRQFCTCT